jgi:hypothetical protein
LNYRNLIAAVGLIAVFGAALRPARASMISHNGLTATIDDSNGAFHSVQFGGTEFFRQGGSFVSDFGFQVFEDENTFAKNDAYGMTEIEPGSTTSLTTATPTVSLDGQSVTVTGNYSAPTPIVGDLTRTANVSFTRVYHLLPNAHIIRISTAITNVGAHDTEALRYFDTYDPDQGFSPFGLGNSTYNDVFKLAGVDVGQSRIDGIFAATHVTHTVLAGSLDSRSTVSTGDPFLAISDGNDLNYIFGQQFDDNDALGDFGIQIAMQTDLPAGATTNYTFDLVFGLTPGAAQDDFVNSNLVPEPATACSLLMGFSAILLFGRSRLVQGLRS